MSFTDEERAEIIAQLRAKIAELEQAVTRAGELKDQIAEQDEWVSC